MSAFDFIKNLAILSTLSICESFITDGLRKTFQDNIFKESVWDEKYGVNKKQMRLRIIIFLSITG